MQNCNASKDRLVLPPSLAHDSDGRCRHTAQLQRHHHFKMLHAICSAVSALKPLNTSHICASKPEIKGGINNPDKFCWLCHYSHYLKGFQNVSETELVKVPVQQTAASSQGSLNTNTRRHIFEHS